MSEWSGSSFEGPIKNGWFEGEGRFRFPNGVVYLGQFHKGEFHGTGTLVYPNGGRYEAQWNRSVATEGQYRFSDGLEYKEKNWEYLKQTDRRFYSEILDELKPAGRSQLTNDTPAPHLPDGTFDVGNGYFDVETGRIVPFDGGEEEVISNRLEVQEVVETCRKGFTTISQNSQNLSLLSLRK